MIFARYLLGIFVICNIAPSWIHATGMNRARSARLSPIPVQLYIDKTFNGLFLDGHKVKIEESIRTLSIEGKHFDANDPLPSAIIDIKKDMIIKGINGKTLTVDFPFVDDIQLGYEDDELSYISLKLKNTDQIEIQGVQSNISPDGIFRFDVHGDFEAKTVTLSAKTGIQVSYDLNFPFQRDPLFIGAFFGGSIGTSIPGIYKGLWMKMLGPTDSFMDGLSVTLSAASSSDSECTYDKFGCVKSGLYEGMVGFSPFSLHRSRAFQPYFEFGALSQVVLVDFEKQMWMNDGTTRTYTRNNTEFRLKFGASIRFVPIVLFKRIELSARLNWIPVGIHLNVKPDSLDTITDGNFLLFFEFGFSLWP